MKLVTKIYNKKGKLVLIKQILNKKLIIRKQRNKFKNKLLTKLITNLMRISYKEMLLMKK